MGKIVKVSLSVGIGFLLLGLMLSIGAGPFLDGWTALRSNGNASLYTGFVTVASAGPTLIVLGIILTVAIGGYMGIKLSGKRG